MVLLGVDSLTWCGLMKLSLKNHERFNFFAIRYDAVLDRLAPLGLGIQREVILTPRCDIS